MNREKLKLTKGEAIELVWDALPGYTIISNDNVTTTRWSEIRRLVVQRNSDKKYFADNYSRGLTEIQDEQPFDDTEPDFTEVFPVEKKYINYE